MGLACAGPIRAFHHKEPMTKSEVCQLLGISEKTLQRRMLKGVYSFTRNGVGQYAPVSFTMTDIGLPEPPAPVEAAPAPAVAEVIAPEPVVTVPSRLSNIELKRQQDEVFADLFKRGEATDSAGNTINGSNAKWPTKGVPSLLGPTEPRERVRVSTTDHMTSPVGGGERIENPVDSDAYRELIEPGHNDRKQAMYRECGLHQLSESEQKIYNDKLAIQASFRNRWAR
jgi:hypothetical protein